MKQLILLTVLLAACGVSETKAKEVLRKAGYTNIEIGSYAPFSCGEDDDFASDFTATNPAGVQVSGTVCCGMLKSCTIRF